MRAYRKRTANAATKRYEKTLNGFLMRAYRNMKSRVTGVQHKKSHLYLGLSILDKITFYNWSRSNLDFNVLFEQWTKSEYTQSITPSVDRIDSSKGYELENMRWITHGQNSRLGSLSPTRKRS